MGAELSPAVEAVAYSSAALLASIDRNYDLAETWFEHALVLGEHAPWVVPTVFANRARSRTAQAFSGRAMDGPSVLADAGEDFKVALDFFNATELAAGLATTLPFAAWHAILIGQPELAESYCERTIAIGEEHGYGWPTAVARAIRGLLRLSQSLPDDAVAHLKEAEAGFETWGDRYSMQITESFYAAAQLRLDDVDTAVRAISHALSIMETQGSREWEAMTTGIALAVMQRVDGSEPIRAACHQWLETNHRGWSELLDTVGLYVVAEPSTPDDLGDATASRIARDCRMALDEAGEKGGDRV